MFTLAIFLLVSASVGFVSAARDRDWKGCGSCVAFAALAISLL